MTKVVVRWEKNQTNILLIIVCIKLSGSTHPLFRKLDKLWILKLFFVPPARRNWLKKIKKTTILSSKKEIILLTYNKSVTLLVRDYQNK